ncbi:aldo/keto reductase [Rhizobium sp. No.120]
MVRHAIQIIGAPIATVQVEYHPFLSQAPLLDYLRRRNIPLTAYAPLAQGRVSEDATLAAIGRKHGYTAA